MFEELLRDWDGEEVVVRYDAPTGAWMFVCIHSTVLGPGGGGTRMKVYPDPAAALADGLRLSSAMTRKNAAADLPLGGAKAVLAVPAIPSGERRRRLMQRYADVVASLGGTYRTACDMNTTSADMDVVAERCPYVLGRSVENGGAGDSGPATAVGVFHGIRASARRAFGSDDLNGRVVLVQGVGEVGSRLAELLVEAGAKVLVSDPVADRVHALADRLGVAEVAPEDAIATECDVFAPCAVGGILNAESIPRLRCRVVAGAANNQLARDEHAVALRKAGVLYAPDYIINSGGIIHLVALEMLRWSRGQLDERLRGIEDTLAEVFRRADEEDVTPETAAERIVERRLASARR